MAWLGIEGGVGEESGSGAVGGRSFFLGKNHLACGGKIGGKERGAGGDFLSIEEGVTRRNDNGLLH